MWWWCRRDGPCLSGAVGIPGMTLVLVILGTVYLRLKLNRTVSNIGYDETTGYHLTGGMRGKYAVSEDGMKVVQSLRKQWRNKSALRGFTVLLITVIYLPITRMCMHAFDCEDTGGGRNGCES